MDTNSDEKFVVTLCRSNSIGSTFNTSSELEYQIVTKEEVAQLPKLLPPFYYQVESLAQVEEENRKYY